MNKNKKKNSIPTKAMVKQMIESSKAKVTDKFLSNPIFNVSTIPSAGTLYTPLMPAQGVSSSQRTGDSICLDEIQMRFLVTTTSVGDLVRLIVLQAKSINVPTIASVLDTGASGLIEVTSFVNAYAKDTEFHILSDTVTEVAASSSRAFVLHALNIKSKISKINFNAGSATAEQGQVYMILMSENVSALTASSLELRYKFHDL
jgi:hypothetical protein